MNQTYLIHYKEKTQNQEAYFMARSRYEAKKKFKNMYQMQDKVAPKIIMVEKVGNKDD